MWGEAGWMEGGLIHSPVIGALLFPDFVADYWSRKNVQRRPPVMKPTTEIPAASLYLCIFQQTEKMLLFHIIQGSREATSSSSSGGTLRPSRLTQRCLMCPGSDSGSPPSGTCILVRCPNHPNRLLSMRRCSASTPSLSG